MYDIEFSEDRDSIVCEDHLLQVIDDDFVAAIRTEGSLYGGSDGSARINVAQDCAVFGIVAVVLLDPIFCAVVRGTSSLLVAWLEQPAVGGVGYRQRHAEWLCGGKGSRTTIHELKVSSSFQKSFGGTRR